jgi:hypothetical protein
VQIDRTPTRRNAWQAAQNRSKKIDASPTTSP